MWLHVHHIIFHCRGDVTVPENLVMVCGSCHRAIHQGCLRVAGEAPGSLADRQGRSMRELRRRE